MASLFIHVAIVTALITLRFPEGIVEPPRPARVVFLVAPVPSPIPRPASIMVAAPVPVETYTARATKPRPFRAPAARFIPAPLELVVPPIDLPRAVLPLLVPQLIAAVPAPPLRTDNFAGSSVVARAAVPAAVRTSGFESVSIVNDVAPRRRPSSSARFEDATVAEAVPAVARPVAAPPLTRPVEILSKPRPVYTEEARSRHIEGEVLLEIVFSASGRVRVLRTVRGLGYGLDESATAAAETIRFRPAERAGVAADSTAVVHIAFQLAY